MQLNYEATQKKDAASNYYEHKATFESSNELFLYRDDAYNYDKKDYCRYHVGVLIDGVCYEVSSTKTYDVTCIAYSRVARKADGTISSTVNNISWTFEIYSDDMLSCDGYVFKSLGSAQLYYDDNSNTEGIVKKPDGDSGNMLEKIKLSIRRFHTMLDDDITSNIDACMLDLRRVGISAAIAVSTSNDALIIKAAELYCKWQYDFNGKGDQFEKAYNNLRDSLSLCDDYTESEDAENV